jgi:hypothetical protein
MALEAGLRDILDRELALMPLLQRVAKRPPEKAVDARQAATALAAAECVAAAAGRPMADPPPLLLRWLTAHPAPPAVPLMAAAIKALDRLRAEAARTSDASLDDLRARLHGGGR